jgi:hypothetical protein
MSPKAVNPPRNRANSSTIAGSCDLSARLSQSATATGSGGATLTVIADFCFTLGRRVSTICGGISSMSSRPGPVPATALYSVMQETHTLRTFA